MNLPTALTLARIAMVPIMVGTIYLPETFMRSGVAQATAMVIFVLAALTDWLDGYLARMLGQTSEFGAFLDPVADKIMMSASLILLVHMGRLHSLVAVVIIAREISVSALREWMAAQGRRGVVAVAALGKAKTAMQMTAVPFLLVDVRVEAVGISSVTIGTVLIWTALLLTIWSMADYLRAAASALRGPISATPASKSPAGMASTGG
ncbi:MAG: CDP-diacylglycerol--glycerol-3-phosphate 3-phosphatidyltransferase [Nevskiaceae bacterium]|nr:MAG: CDP-diacylglycerol--glycerol-3-phosphate 3-phosphatidyltransferase [Nevskiaceae bacterium]